MSSKLLLVEPSATMRHVLENYAQSLGFGVVTVGEYNLAENALREQFSSFGDDFACVLLGWPIVASETSDSFIETLESPDNVDIPVVVMSTDMRAETRAWVAGRDHTAVLPWKEYQDLKVMLQRLIVPTQEKGDTFDAKFDNSDISLLIVDDSVSIRFALRDLFELQGYRVSVASSQDEAIELARQQYFDVAILDFYLQDSTGDRLCRKLLTDPATGQPACAILTGSYADHIIKRSLRAGALECMFKNESSELLLARIDALSRFVRQRKQVATEQQRLDGIIDTLAGAIVVVNDDDKICYMSDQAASMLGFGDRNELLGQAATEVVDLNQVRDNREGKFRAQWRDASQRLINVVYRQITLDRSRDKVLNFKVLPGIGGSAVLPQSAQKAQPTQLMEQTQSAHLAQSGQRTQSGQQAKSGQQVQPGQQTNPFTRAVAAAASRAATQANIQADNVGVTSSNPGTVEIETANSHPLDQSAEQNDSLLFAQHNHVSEDRNDVFDEPASASVRAVNAAEQIVSQLDLLPHSVPFVKTLLSYPSQLDEMQDYISLLMVDVFGGRVNEPLETVDVYPGLSEVIQLAMLDVYKREGHVARLGKNRFGFILRHTTEPQAYLLTRKIMQICNSIETGEEGLQLSCTGCLSSISNNVDQNAFMMLSRVGQGLDVVNTRGGNQALLLDLRRMLPVYASSSN